MSQPEILTCLYINLDEHTDRREHMQAQVAELDFPVERWPAVRGTAGLLSTTYARFAGRGVRRYLDKMIGTPTEGTFHAVVGCYLSHVTAMEHLAASHAGDQGHVLVLEDDVRIMPGFCSALRSALASPALADADLMRLDCCSSDTRHNSCLIRPDGRKKDQVAHGIYRLSTPWFKSPPLFYNGSYGVVYRCARLPRLLEVLERRPIGDYDGTWNCKLATEHVRQYVVFTGHLRIAPFGSTIRPHEAVAARGLITRLQRKRRRATGKALRLANALGL